jgi:YVTN family beta-propeller protein
VDSGSGIISGTATAPGQSQIVISASNAIGVAMAYLTLTAGTPPTLPLTLAINGNGSVINGSPALNNKLQAGSTNLPAGSFVSLTATASPGYAFAGWSGGVTSTVNPLNFLIQTATSIQANFIPATLGAIDATFNLPVSRFALDPVRPRMYATVTASNSVAVIDTSTLSLVQLIPTGASPIGLAVSPDGSRLYVANSGSTTNGVTVIDLTTLSVLSSLSVPNAPYEIVLGAGGMLYLSCETIPNGISPYGLMQITTGGTLVSQSIAVETISSGCELGISPDLNTLYFGSGDAIGTFDVSTGTPVQSQYYDGLQEGGDDLEVSHSGASVAYPCIQNTLIEGVPDIPSSDLTKINGICMCGDNGVNAAFSPDDSIIYTQPVTSGTMLVYGTNPFSGVGSFKVTGDASRLKTDSSGKYLFASVFNYGSETPVSIKVYDTGRPAAVITSATASFTQTGATYNYQIAATNNPTSFGATGLPAGLTVDPATGIISGTTTIPGDSQAIISASNAIGIAMADLNINVFGSGTTAALTVSVSGSGTVQSAYLGTTYPTLGSTISLSATAASGYYFSGWTGGITSAANPLTFVIETATAVQANFLPTPFALTSATENGLDYGNSFTYQIVAPGAGPFTYGATGLPAGLTVDPATGLISGTLADAGNFDVLLTATNGIGAPGSGLLSLQVNAILTVNGSVGGITSPTGTSYSARGASASIQAFPLAGYLFQDWTGPFTSASNPLVFSMPAAADWTANFVPSSIYKGNYAGLFVAGTPGVESSGYLSITLGRSGNFTGSLVLGGAQYKIAGTFAPGDTALITLHRAGQSPITINLTLDLSGSTPLVTGTASDGTWTSVLSTSIEPVLSIRDPSLLAGAYTAALNASTQSLTVPAGSGYATVTVSDAGLAQIAGSLADGTPFSTSATIQADGTLPVYCPLYGRKGGIEGVLAFDSASSPVSLSGTLNWWKPQTTARLYPAAFATTLDVAGSGYARAAGLPGTSGTLSIIGGGLNPDIGQPFTLNSAHGVVIAAQSVHPVKFTLGLNTGVFTGSFYEGATKETFHGVILQNQDSGAGFFLDSTASGQVGLSVSP